MPGQSMNQQVRELAIKANLYVDVNGQPWPRNMNGEDIEGAYQRFAELIIEATLDAVAERAYYTGDRDWSDDVDRPWVQLEFGLGTLAQAQRKAGFTR